MHSSAPVFARRLFHYQFLPLDCLDFAKVESATGFRYYYSLAADGAAASIFRKTLLHGGADSPADFASTTMLKFMRMKWRMRATRSADSAPISML